MNSFQSADAQLSEPLLPGSSETPDGGDGSETGTSDESKDIVVSCGQSTPLLRVNHNVLLTMVVDSVCGVSEGLWSDTLFPVYLKRVSRGYNRPVGNIEATSGIAELLSALPVGYLADRIGHDKVIRAGGILMGCTVVLQVFVLGYVGVNENKLQDGSNIVAKVLLGVVMALWGIGGGVVTGPCEALYADSIPAGSRTQYYHYLLICYMLASCVGPLVSIILFQILGDDWNLRDERIVIYVGLGLDFVLALLMMFFDDEKALIEEEEDEDDEEESDEGGQPSEKDSCVACEGGIGEEDEDEDEPIPTASRGPTPQMEGYREWTPYIIFVSSLIYSIGSGMTIEFFPLFFKDDVGLSPTKVQIIYVLVPLVMIPMSGLGMKVASWFGRVQTIIVLDCLGICCLYPMVFFKDYLDNHPFVLVPIYILRTALMNSSYPLHESILMDFVPKGERGRWKSLESVSAFGWCGSAALGGYVADNSDYTNTFFVTGLMQSFAIMIFALLLPLVPRQEQHLRSE